MPRQNLIRKVFSESRNDASHVRHRQAGFNFSKGPGVNGPDKIWGSDATPKGWR